MASRTNAPWSKSEEIILIKAYTQGRSIERIARSHLRKTSSIAEKLAELNANRRLDQIREEDFEWFIDELFCNYTVALGRFLEEEHSDAICRSDFDASEPSEARFLARPNSRKPDPHYKENQESDGSPLQSLSPAVDFLASLATNISVSKQEIARIVSERDEPAACLHLGIAFEYGFGLPESIDLASKWYMLGARIGDPECKRLYERSLCRRPRHENASVVINGSGNYSSAEHIPTSDWSESFDDLEQDYWEDHFGGPDDTLLEDQARRQFDADHE